VPSGDAAFVLVRGVLGIGPHQIAFDPVMGVIKPMKPTVEGSESV
jgi:hypothetical protein